MPNPYTRTRNVERASFEALAAYYCWSARKGFATGKDPRTGRPWPLMSQVGKRLGRASFMALAREALAISREMGPYPLP